MSEQTIKDAIEDLQSGIDHAKWIDSVYVEMPVTADTLSLAVTALRTQLAPVSEDVDRAIDWIQTGKYDTPIGDHEYQADSRFHPDTIRFRQTILAALRAQIEPGWIKVSEKFPEHDKTVLLTVQTYNTYLKRIVRRVIRGCHIESGKMDASEWTEYDDTTYSEEDDTYYINEGWFEQIDFWDEYQYAWIDSDWTVTHWMPLPEPPKDGEE